MKLLSINDIHQTNFHTKFVASLLIASFFLTPLGTFAATKSENTSSSNPPSHELKSPESADRTVNLTIQDLMAETPSTQTTQTTPQNSKDPSSQTTISALSVEDDDPDHPLYKGAGTQSKNSNVSARDGSFEYSIPLRIPPGRLGMTPELSLNYSSSYHRETDIFGYGWQASIPYIERINKIGTQALYSTTTPSYFYSALSGELATTSSAGVYQDQVDKGEGWRYTLTNNVWVATGKSGITYTFGTTSSYRQDNPSNSTQIYRWMVSKIEEPNGNFITYTK